MNKLPYESIDQVRKYFTTLYGEDSNWQYERYQGELSRFKKEFNVKNAYIASSSGRVEVIGNHTDHNGGYVVSCAISLDTIAMFLPTDDNKITIKSLGYDDIIVDCFGDEIEKIGTSSALVRGVVVGLKERGYKVGGFNACFSSNVLGGAGISSSASFEVLVTEILNFLYNEDKIDNETKSKISQFSENKYFGKPCGLLDQTAIAYGGLKKLDFSDKEKIQVTNINNSLKDYTLILVNTGGSHENLTDEYASIPREMLSIANLMGRERLIDIPEKEFYEKLPSVMDKVCDRAICRAVHFYNECKRVNIVKESLENRDYETFLAQINNSGISSLTKLQNCYVPGSDEQLIPKALSICENYLHGGANRVHGGGFAGTILNIVKNDFVNDFIANVSRFYKKEDIIPLKVRACGTIVL